METRKKKSAASCLKQLKKFTTIVSDTADIDLASKFEPTDATTNPSLVLAASRSNMADDIIDKALAQAEASETKEDSILEELFDRVCVLLGCNILKKISGRVSTEVDASLSYNTEATIDRAVKLISLYKEQEVDKDRVLIKIAATWEGIKAAEILEKDHAIHCNLTLIFHVVQAAACAEAKVTLISPFVGRITDWYTKKLDKTISELETELGQDPGVKAVQEIYNYLKKYDYKTEVMGASFRTVDQVQNLAGCDLLTISPSLLEELENSNAPLTQKLSVHKAKKSTVAKMDITQEIFKQMIDDSDMAKSKLAEGIKKFGEDADALKEVLRLKLASRNKSED